MALMVVERPEPLRPSRLTISPGFDLQVDAVEDVALAVKRVQVVNVQHAQTPASAAWFCASTEPR